MGFLVLLLQLQGMRDGSGNFRHVLLLTISRLVQFSGSVVINQVERLAATQD